MIDNNNQNRYNSNYPPTPPKAPPMANGYNPQPQRQYTSEPYAPQPQTPPATPQQPPYVPQPEPQPVAPQQPPYAPQPEPQPVAPQQPPYVPQPEPQPATPQQPPYAPQPEPRTPFNPPQAPTYNPPQAPTYAPASFAARQPAHSAPENDFGYSQPAPHIVSRKQPMSGGLKALIIILSSLLVLSLAGLIAVVVSNNSNQSGRSKQNSFDARDDSELPYDPYEFFEFDEDETTAPTAPADLKEYGQSDAKDKVNKNYSGLKLGSKPASGKSGSSYAFGNVEDSVVSIICYVDGQEGTAESYTIIGTGLVLSEDGYIVTNSHIISNSRTAYMIKIITNDNKEYDAGVVGYDSRSDLAVLKVDAKGLKPAAFGDSDEIEVTEDVIVVGNPLSLNYYNSVTKGIVSAVDRQVSITNNVRYIQTDAAINPGNSGGPMCNMYGQVIGIATSKIALDDYEGMGFAIPSKRIKQVTDDIIRYGFVQNRVKIGVIGEVSYISEGRGTAIQIKEIVKDGPMESTGAKTGDYVTEVDGKKVANFAEMYDALEKYKAGDKVKLTLYRKSNDREYKVTVTLQADEP